MLQRIQSLYLALVALIACSLFVSPFCLSVIPGIPPSGDIVYRLNLLSLTRSADGLTETVSIPWFLIVMNLVITGLTLITLFSYGNRKRQMLLCRLGLLLMCAFAGLLYWTEEQMKKNGGGQLTYLIGTYLPLIQFVLFYLAERAIKKDDDLVRSADRLR